MRPGLSRVAAPGAVEMVLVGVVRGAGGYLVAVIDVRTLARPLLASSFIVGGYRVLRNPGP